jgi:hypothetical protein
MVMLRDSITAVTDSPEYQTVSRIVQSQSLMELAFDGVGFQIIGRKVTHTWSASLVDFSPVGGWRVGPTFLLSAVPEREVVAHLACQAWRENL